MIDILHQRVTSEVLDDLLRVLGVSVEPQGEGLHALQEQECVKRRNSGACVAQQDRPDVGNEGCRTNRIIERNAVVAGIGIRQLGIFSAGAPVEFAGLDDDAAQCRAVASDEFRRGVDDDGGSPCL